VSLTEIRAQFLREFKGNRRRGNERARSSTHNIFGDPINQMKCSLCREILPEYKFPGGEICNWCYRKFVARHDKTT